MTLDTIGIDIAKEKFDAYRMSDKQHRVFANTAKGFREFEKWLTNCDIERIVFETTGAYHQSFERNFAGRLPLVKVNPLQAKRFAQSMGTRAKTDKVDAKMLAQMGISLKKVADTPKDKNHHILSELRAARVARVARAALIKAKGAEKNAPMKSSKAYQALERLRRMQF